MASFVSAQIVMGPVILPATQTYRRHSVMHLLGVLTYLPIHVCSPEKEKTEVLMQEERNFYSPAKKHRQFDKSSLSRENAALQKHNSMALSPLLPHYVQGFGGCGFN